MWEKGENKWSAMPSGSTLKLDLAANLLEETDAALPPSSLLFLSCIIDLVLYQLFLFT